MTSPIPILTEPQAENLGTIPFQEYLQIPALNQSLIKKYHPDYDGCPQLFKWHLSGGDKPDTEALRKGRQFHDFFLDPNAFRNNYAEFTPEIGNQILADARAAGSKSETIRKCATYMDVVEHALEGQFWRLGPAQEWKAIQKQLGKEVVTPGRLKEMTRMKQEIQANPVTAAWFHPRNLDTHPNQGELSLTASVEVDKGAHLPLKARLDSWFPEQQAIIDTKTARSVSPRQFGRQFVQLGYDIQAAQYLRVARANGLDAKRFLFLAIEQEPPYLCNLFEAEPDVIQYADRLLETTCRQIYHSIKENSWPGPEPFLEIPQWRMEEIEQFEAA